MPTRTEEINDPPPHDEGGFFERPSDGWSDDDQGEWCQDVFVSG